VTATGPGGSDTAGVTIAVADLPPVISYSPSTVVDTLGKSTSHSVTSTSGSVTVYHISPALPSGLTLDTLTGAISGTPGATATAANYVVTGTNASGSDTAGIRLSVVNARPVISYILSTVVDTVGKSATHIISSTGGVVDSFVVSPTLPAGLSLNKTSGAITGIPSAAQSSVFYTVTAIGSGGTDTAGVSVSVVDMSPVITYVRPALNLVKRTAIIPDTATNTGGPITVYHVSPALPAGLTLDTVTGRVSGTPTVVAAVANYTVTATGPGGNGQTILSIAVQDTAPAFFYRKTPVIFARGAVAPPDSVINTGGAVTVYHVSPALPAGLALDTVTGVIGGTPTGVSIATNYTVTGTGPGGSGAAVVNIRVVAPPGNLSYSDELVTYVVGVPITENTPAVSGYVTHYSVRPALSPGLRIDSVSGLISGTPTGQSFATNDTVTASSFAGSTTFVISITVVGAPSNLSYDDEFPTYKAGTAISPSNVPTVQGIVTQWSVTPALPAGITLNATTGYISGTPVSSSAGATYTITASNTGGSVQRAIFLQVNP